MAAPMTSEQANAVYGILVELAGAPDHPQSFLRADFILHQQTGSTDEYRFMGALGGGGKFWNCNGRWYVSCYREDMTDMRQRMVDAANEALAELRARVAA